jgi:glycosyltransferase involved in cell wall biosynthesis
VHKKLTIVTDTAIYKIDGKYYAFGPVIRELEFIEHLFDEITWIGYNRPDLKHDLIMQEVASKKIKIVLLKRVGGKNILSFFKIIFNYPIMFFIILKNIYHADIVHTRAPSHPALIAGMISFFFQKKIWWNKFAGNWAQVNPPKSYGFQRFLFEKSIFAKITINGFWDNQLPHCISFENPCLYETDITIGEEVAKNKIFKPPFVFSFAGRLEIEKGVDRIIDALKVLPEEFLKEVHFIGDGYKTDFYKKECEFLGKKAIFHGFVGKDKVHEILSKAHFFILPTTASEGFPKVIAEAACYGTIPLVSNVSSIPHYINDENGFVWDINGKISFSETLSIVVHFSEFEFQKKQENVLNVAKMFTFDNYLKKIKFHILKTQS